MAALAAAACGQRPAGPAPCTMAYGLDQPFDHLRPSAICICIYHVPQVDVAVVFSVRGFKMRFLITHPACSKEQVSFNVALCTQQRQTDHPRDQAGQ